MKVVKPAGCAGLLLAQFLTRFWQTNFNTPCTLSAKGAADLIASRSPPGRVPGLSCIMNFAISFQRTVDCVFVIIWSFSKFCPRCCVCFMGGNCWFWNLLVKHNAKNQDESSTIVKHAEKGKWTDLGAPKVWNNQLWTTLVGAFWGH